MSFVGLDLSTKTGYVVLNADGEVLEQKEINISYDNEYLMCIGVDRILCNFVKSDFIAIEGFSYGSKGKSVDKQYGLGWIIRIELLRQKIPFAIVPPAILKKFAGAKGNDKKDALAVEIFKRWAYEHPSDNVRDAFVLAQIARGIHYPSWMTKFQQDAIKKVTKV